MQTNPCSPITGNESTFNLEAIENNEQNRYVRQVIGNVNFKNFALSRQLYKKNQIDEKNGWTIPFTHFNIPDEKVESVQLWSVVSSSLIINNKIFDSRIKALDTQTNKIISAIETLKKKQFLKNQILLHQKKGALINHRRQKDQQPIQVFRKVLPQQIDFQNINNEITQEKISDTTFEKRQIPQIQQQIIFENLMKIPYTKMSFRKVNSSNSVLSFKVSQKNNHKNQSFQQNQIDLLLNNQQFFDEVSKLCTETLDQFKFNKLQKVDYQEAEKLYPLGYLSILTRKYYYIIKSIANFLPIQMLQSYSIRQLQTDKIRQKQNQYMMSIFLKPRRYNSNMKPELIDFIQFLKSRYPTTQTSNTAMLDNFLSLQNSQIYSQMNDRSIFNQPIEMNRYVSKQKENVQIFDQQLFQNYSLNLYKTESTKSCAFLSSNPTKIELIEQLIEQQNDFFEENQVNTLNQGIQIKMVRRKKTKKRQSIYENKNIQFQQTINFLSEDNTLTTKNLFNNLSQTLMFQLKQQPTQINSKIMKLSKQMNSFQNTSISSLSTLLDNQQMQHNLQKQIKIQQLKDKCKTNNQKYDRQIKKLSQIIRNLTNNFMDIDYQEQNQYEYFSNQCQKCSQIKTDNLSQSSSNQQQELEFINTKDNVSNKNQSYLSNKSNISFPVWKLKNSKQNSFTSNQFWSFSLLEDTNFIKSLKQQMIDTNCCKYQNHQEAQNQNFINNQQFNYEYITPLMVEHSTQSCHNSLISNNRSLIVSINQLASTQLTSTNCQNKIQMKNILAQRFFQKTRFQANIQPGCQDDQISKQVQTQVVEFTMIGDIKLIYYCVVKLGATTFNQISELIKKFKLPKGIIFTAMIHFTSQFSEMYELQKKKQHSEIIVRKNYNPSNDSEKLKMLKKYYQGLNSSQMSKIQENINFNKQIKNNKNKTNQQVFQRGRLRKRLNNSIITSK